MAHSTNGHNDHGHSGAVEHHAHESHAKLYVGIFVILFIVTGIEVAIPILTAEGILPISKIAEVILLLVLMVAKGAMVTLYYMHLKGDRKMFGSLFFLPMIIVAAMMFGFMFLFQPTLW